MKPTLLTIASVLMLAGCTGSPSQSGSSCGYSLTPQIPPAQEAESVNVSRAFLANHPTLDKLLTRQSAENATGIGEPVDCGEGEDTMAALEAMGAKVTKYDSGTKETTITFENETYGLLMAYSVTG